MLQRIFNAAIGTAILVPALGAGAAWGQQVPSPEEPVVLEEIIVTATKRRVPLQDVPISVTALGADQLARLGATDLAGYANTVPGLSFEQRGPGQNQISIRGLNSLGSPGSVEPVGYYIDDVAQTDEEQSDLELFDIQSVEILRGPQGTLYGEGSLGGTVKINTMTPDLEDVSGLIGGELSSVRYGGTGGAVRGMINAPLVENKAAIRGAAWYRRSAGWIDNVELDRKDANRATVKGGRLALRVKPSERLTIDLRGTGQQLSVRAPQQRNPANGRFAVDLPEEQRRRQDFKQLAATGNFEMDWATLTSVTAYYDRVQNENNLLLLGDLPLRVINRTPVEIWSNETRLASAEHDTYNWIAGVYLLRREDGVNQEAQTIDDDETFFEAKGGFVRKQVALFGEGNLRPIDGLQLTAGLRWFHERNALENLQSYPGLPGIPPNNIDKKATSRAVTPKFTASYKPTDDVMVYATAAKGFRSGGNTFLASLAGIPDTFKPDSAWSYEGGLKTDWLNRRLSVNGAAYHVKWTDIQVLAEPADPDFAGFIYTANAGKAHTSGLEIEVRAVPLPGWNLDLGLGIIEAKFDEAAATIGARKGDRLPGVPRYSFSVATDYSFALSQTLEGTIGGDLRRVGRAVNNYGTAGTQPERIRDYTLVNLKAGVKADAWTAEIFVQNLFDKLVVTGLEDFNGPVPLEYVGQPRTLGVRLSYQY